MGNVESVWDYPRPPRLEATPHRLQVVHRNVILAETAQGLRVLETSHPPVYYIPPADVRTDLLRPSQARQTLCEFKGMAVYWNLCLPSGEDGREVEFRQVAWSYPRPMPPFAPLAGYFAFYPSRVEACFVDGERVQAQAGDFYGGWITSGVQGPFKGGPGTRGW